MPKFCTLDRDQIDSAKLRVVGVGGGGCNAIESMMKKGLKGVEYVAINTDSQALHNSSAHHKIQIGTNITRGLGAGADPNVGRKALEEDREKIESVLKGSDMVFITAGMGGGTGTGGAPLVAGIAKSLGSLVVGIITKPFKWEGKKRMMNAEQGIHELRRSVDSLIVIPNERLLNILDKQVSASAAFDKPNEVLYEATRGIADIITITGIINVDFADVRSVMNESGEALMGCGIASGENRAIEAAQKAISSPLLEGINIKGAKNILLNVTGSNDLTMQEIQEGNKIIYEAAGEEVNIIFGWVNKEDMNEYVSYTVIATGFSSYDAKSKRTAKQVEVDEEQEIEEPIYGGYAFNEEDFNDRNILDIPTIHRVRGTGNFMKDSSGLEKGGFKFDKLKSSKEEHKPKKDEKDWRDEDSSSFLSMMMD
ncbi:MAG: cell division protein FtsZ [Melioribacteraceae bacterium]|nr:cell division protein FtsZ [Melioribacteraceae bacterium]